MAAHDMKINVMKTVSEGTKEIILRRARKENLEELFQKYPALALVHGDVCDMIYASDLAQKASDVQVFEISGSCPQHVTCLGILGDASAVEEAVARIRKVLA
ncbi:MAG: BMC domain-containing protein [Lachnospiraceae bacterium]|nr:BMC domain-containing protein [Lachnospiraceae bacterium]